VFTNKIVWSADVLPIGQGINVPKIFLVADQDTISVCATISMAFALNALDIMMAHSCNNRREGTVGVKMIPAATQVTEGNDLNVLSVKF